MVPSPGQLFSYPQEIIDEKLPGWADDARQAKEQDWKE